MIARTIIRDADSIRRASGKSPRDHQSGLITGLITGSGSGRGSASAGNAGRPSTLPINGTVNGTAISFGTVGSTAITYTGTVSGNSMSGTYKVAGGNGSAGGPWSASKS